MSITKCSLYRELARLVTARRNCIATNNGEWKDKHADTIRELCKSFLPHGSGVDCGAELDLDASRGDRLVFTTSFHHMNDGGMYDGWTEHGVVVVPCLSFGFYLRITGRDRNGIKEYLGELFDNAMKQEVWQTQDCKWHTDAYGPVHEKFCEGAGI